MKMGNGRHIPKHSGVLADLGVRAGAWCSRALSQDGVQTAFMRGILTF